MIKWTRIGCVLTSLILPTAIMAAEPSTNDVRANTDKAMVKVLRDAQARRMKLDSLLAPIKSSHDLYQYLEETPDRISPFSRLSSEARSRFIESLVFNESGLVGFNYADLAGELSPTEIYEVLSLFGAQRTVPLMSGLRATTTSDEVIIGSPVTMMMMKDWEGYRCVSRATCEEASRYICMSGC